MRNGQENMELIYRPFWSVRHPRQKQKYIDGLSFTICVSINSNPRHNVHTNAVSGQIQG